MLIAAGGAFLQGNVDPLVLFGGEEQISKAVVKCIKQAGQRGHILNLGHGVVQGTPEENVGIFCDLARNSASFFRDEAFATV